MFVVVAWLLALRLPPIPENTTVSLATIDAGDSAPATQLSRAAARRSSVPLIV